MLNCPYCDNEQEPYDLNEENEVYEVGCEKCNKIFGVEIEYWLSYAISKLPCSNGKEHKMKKTRRTHKVVNGFERWYCVWCNRWVDRKSECSKDCAKNKIDECWKCQE